MREQKEKLRYKWHKCAEAECNTMYSISRLSWILNWQAEVQKTGKKFRNNDSAPGQVPRLAQVQFDACLMFGNAAIMRNWKRSLNICLRKWKKRVFCSLWKIEIQEIEFVSTSMLILFKRHRNIIHLCISESSRSKSRSKHSWQRMKWCLFTWEKVSVCWEISEISVFLPPGQETFLCLQADCSSVSSACLPRMCQ